MFPVGELGAISSQETVRVQQHPLKDRAQMGDLELENPKAQSSAVLVLANE